MRLIVYTHESFGCGIAALHARVLCKEHGIEFLERNPRWMLPLHEDLLRKNDWDGFYPAFVVEDGELLRAFNDTGWSAFEAEIKGEG